jgi:hypothetical protein
MMDFTERFEEFLEPWPRCANPDLAARAWLSVVTSPAEVLLVFACRDRYLMSDEVSRNVVQEPSRWLMDQKAAKWGGKWPMRAGLQKIQRDTVPKPTKQEHLDALHWMIENDIDPAMRIKAAQALDEITKC